MTGDINCKRLMKNEIIKMLIENARDNISNKSYVFISKKIKLTLEIKN